MAHSGRLLIFTGDGKGKTTAALGMALRAAGHGLRVLVFQFLKKDASVGELAGLAQLRTVDVRQRGAGFVPPVGHPQRAKHEETARAALAEARELVAADEHDLIVLDELCGAVSLALLTEDDALGLIEAAGDDMILVLTGRGATRGLIERADTVTEMRCVKHGHEQDIPAQKGVER